MFLFLLNTEMYFSTQQVAVLVFILEIKILSNC